jgi:predicted lipoprotein with Yx(FWY)xxD motif
MIKNLSILLLCISAMSCIRLKQAEILTNITTLPTEQLDLRTFYNDLLGDYIGDWNNMSLYMFQEDHIGTGFTLNDFDIKCYDDCAIAWPPLLLSDANSMFRAGSGLFSNLFGYKLRRDGTYQFTYNNIPLYYYIGDKNPGDILGHRLNANGGFWYLVNPSGMPIM